MHAPDVRIRKAPRRRAGLASKGLFRRTLNYREGRIGFGVSVAIAVVIVGGPFFAPYSITATTGFPLAGASMAHLLGTDEYGRDVLSRVLTGGGDIVLLPVIGICCAFILGGLTGLIAGFKGGRSDRYFIAVVNIVLSIPALLVVLVLVGAGRDSAFVVAAAITLVYAPFIARIVRGVAQASASSEYVDVARLRGEGAVSIALREVLPNVAGTVAVELPIRCTQAVLLVATLDFLGVGAQPPSPSWGLMVADGQQFVLLQPLCLVGPAVALALLAIGLNLFSGAMQRAVAERQR